MKLLKNTLLLLVNLGVLSAFYFQLKGNLYFQFVFVVNKKIYFHIIVKAFKIYLILKHFLRFKQGKDL